VNVDLDPLGRWWRCACGVGPWVRWREEVDTEPGIRNLVVGLEAVSAR
jgi:hypothetical protein